MSTSSAITAAVHHYFFCAISMLLSTPPSTPPCSCPVRGQSAMLLSIQRSSGARSSGAHYYYCRCICGFVFVFPSASGSNVRSSNSIRRRVPGISHVSDFNYTESSEVGGRYSISNTSRGLAWNLPPPRRCRQIYELMH